MTSLWSFVHQHKSKTAHVVLGLVLFAAGWQLGRTTSPYYAAHPIIFKEQEPAGSKEELVILKEEGSEPQRTSITAPTTSPAVASATQTQGQFVGSINSDLYHAPGCPSVSRIKEENQVWFTSVQEAEAAGYKPSKCTQEKLNI